MNIPSAFSRFSPSFHRTVVQNSLNMGQQISHYPMSSGVLTSRLQAYLNHRAMPRANLITSQRNSVTGVRAHGTMIQPSAGTLWLEMI